MRSTASWPPRNLLVSSLVSMAVVVNGLVTGWAGLGGVVQDARLNGSDVGGAGVGEQHRDQAGAQQPAAAPGAVHRRGRVQQGVHDAGTVAGRGAAGAGTTGTRGQVGRRELEERQPVLADGGGAAGVSRLAVAGGQVLLDDGGAGRRGEAEVGGGRGDELDGGEAHLERGAAG